MRHSDPVRLGTHLVVFAFLLRSGLVIAAAEDVTFEVRDQATNRLVPCRIHLSNTAGESFRPEGLPFWRDHFVCPGRARLELPEGNYVYEVERGPEYLARSGSFAAAVEGFRKVDLEMRRITNLAAEGWWSGEMHVHRPIDEIELLMRAEDLHVAPVISWWNNRNLWSDRPVPDRLLTQFDSNRYYGVMGGEDEREGGALLFFHLPRPLPISGAGREFPSPMQFLKQARSTPGAWIDIEKPFWWDVPVWLASGEIDSIGLANNHMCRDQMFESEAWGKPRDTARLPNPIGNGYWTQEIYYHILNCGIRIPPSAGSASGVLPNPVGYNRIYAHVPGPFEHEQWWNAVKAGRSFVTNGPLLRVRANGELPGHVFRQDSNGVLVDLDVSIASRDPIRVIEVVCNGRVEQAIAGAEFTRGAKLRNLKFDASGWFLVRAIADNSKTFRFASTAPFYVECGDSKRRISRSSAQFFLDWSNERLGRIKLDDPDQRREVEEYHHEAVRYWSARVAEANAD
jgi:hypothetical protein